MIACIVLCAALAGPAPKKPVVSKAAAMMGKMGWVDGQGLGAGGTGRTEAIATDLYAPGVGLGAQGGKVGDAVAEAALRTQATPSDTAQRTLDKTRERYNQLS